MSSHYRRLARAMVGMTALTASAVGLACSLVPADPQRITQIMRKEIAFRLAINVEQISLSDITAPQLHRPLELGADCSGLAALHHSSGFRIAVATQQHAFATMGRPHTASGTGSRYRDRVASGFYSGRDRAGVRGNLWRAPKQQGAPEGGHSGPVRWPQYPHESQFTWHAPQQTPMRWSTLGVAPAQPAAQGLCRYEGVAVVLGYDGSSPVAVNFQQHCD